MLLARALAAQRVDTHALQATQRPPLAEPLCAPSFRLGHASTGRRAAQLRFGRRPAPRRLTSSHQLQRAGPSAGDGGSAASSDDYSDGELAGAGGSSNGAAPVSAAAVGVATAAITAARGGQAPGEEPRGGALESSDEESRWHDAMHRALMESLQPPRSEHPSWWGQRSAKLQRRMAEVLESREAHYLVIGLVLLDLAIVLTELVLSSFYPTPELAPHLVHVAEEALSYSSIGILAVFTAELVAKLLVMGWSYFTSSNWHMFDAVVVVTSFTLELSLRGVAQEVASLLIFFRLWRIMRIMHGVAEAMELNHSQEMSHLQLRNQQLEAELSVSQQKLQELAQQVALLNVAAAAKGIDLHFVLSTAAAAQQQLAATAQQQLLAAAAATASKGMELQTILAAAAAQQQQVAATAQQQLLSAAAAAAAAGTPLAPASSAAGSAAAAGPLMTGDAAAAAVAAAMAHSAPSSSSSASSSSDGHGQGHSFRPQGSTGSSSSAGSNGGSGAGGSHKGGAGAGERGGSSGPA